VNKTNALISDFLKNIIDYPALEQALIEDVLNGTPVSQIENIIDNGALGETLPEIQISNLKQALHNCQNDKTIVKISNDDADQTVLANKDTESDNDRTILASQQNNTVDVTVIDDKTRLQTPVVNNKTYERDEREESATVISDQASSQAQKFTSHNKLEPGRIINNRFVLEKLLGQGGMGSVFKARDLRKEEANDSNSHIAIKFLNEDFKQHPQALISLQREAKKSQTLAHPNIITVHDFDRDGDTVYMTMEYLEGAPLDEYLSDHKHTGIEKDTALKIIDDISQALSYAHQKNIVHSDFKPGNIFVTNDGTAKILDFGIARAVKSIGDKNTDSGSENTQFDAGELGGLTPTYASCEMLEGKQPSPSDDMYALGCVAYELLTGTHPFARQPANRARDANKTPEVIKQLDRKQSNALIHTLQFSRESRTQDAQTFIQEFFIRKQNSKILIATLGIAAVLLIAIGIKYFIDYQQQIATEELVVNIKKGDSSVIAQAIPELKLLEGETREAALKDVRPMVVQYFSSIALPLADQSKGKYDFPSALGILSDAQQLYPDSAQVNDLIIQLVNSQNQLTNTLAAQIDKYLQKGNLTSAVYNNDIQDIIDLLKIAAPESHLLKDTRIQLAYVREIKTALKEDKLDNVNILIKSALSLFSDDNELLELKANFKEREAQLIEDQQLLSLQKQLTEEGKVITEPVRVKALNRHTEKLTSLVNKGFNGPSWLNKIQSEIVALDVFARSETDKQQQLRDAAATLILQQARENRRSGHLTEARMLLKLAIKVSPSLTALTKEKRALTIAERNQQTSHSNKEKSAKIATLRQSLLNQAKSDDIKNATKTFKSLKKLDPKSRFIKIDATEAIANAYLRLSRGLADRKEFESAIKLTKSGIEIAPHYVLAKNLQKEYLAEIAILNLNHELENIYTINIKNSKHQLKTIKRGLPDRFATIEINAATLFLNRIKELAKSDQDKAKNLIDMGQQIFPDNSEISALTKRSSKFQSAGGQPCKKSYAGHGKRTRATCFDMITDTIKAPLMVVIPSISKSTSVYAVSKYEISVGEFNNYCTISGECNNIKNIGDELPVTNVSVEKINDYLKWITLKTGQKYQLPTDAQWHHAANAKGSQPKKDFNCRLMLGSKQIKGNNLLNTKSGKVNGWGLKNYVGNVQELVTRNAKYYVRGGAYTDSFSQCDIDLKRAYSGKPDDITGFRIIKVL